MDYSIGCIKSIHGSDYHNLAVVFVDNHSEDESVHRISEEFPSATIVETDRNIGYAGGNNRGIKAALKYNPDYILIVNNDVEVHTTCISELVKVAKSSDNMGIVGTHVHDFVTRSRPTGQGGRISLAFGLDLPVTPPLESCNHNLSWNADFVSGSTMLIKRTLLERIGFFREDFCFFWEDADLCLRARDNGYLIRVAAHAISWHRGGGTMKKVPKVRIYYSTRNRILIVRLHGGIVEKCFFLLVYLWLDTAVRLGYYLLRSRSAGTIRALLKGTLEGLTWEYTP